MSIVPMRWSVLASWKKSCDAHNATRAQLSRALSSAARFGAERARVQVRS